MKDVYHYITRYLIVTNYKKSLRLDLEKCDLAARTIKRTEFEPREYSIIIIPGRVPDKDFLTYTNPALGSQNRKMHFHQVWHQLVVLVKFLKRDFYSIMVHIICPRGMTC